MRKRFCKFFSITLSAVVCAMSFLLSGCGGGGALESSSSGGDSKKATKIVIYAGGSSEFSWIKGTEEDRVINYIEQKYYDETGNLLDFEIAYLGENMRQKLTTELSGGTQVDIAISHTRGGVGIDDFVLENRLAYDISEDLYTYAPNLVRNISGQPLNSLTTYEGAVIGIPSVINPYKFGILVRKDYMERVGYTDDQSKTSQVCVQTGSNYKLVETLDDFEDMCKAINGITNNSYAVSGAMWDAEKSLVLGAYTNSGYFTKAVRNYTGKDGVYPGYTTDEYFDVLKKEYDWVKSGVFSAEANAILLEQAESTFISGKTGVFVQDPTIQHLIQVARKTKIANPDAEFTVLGPLTKDQNSTMKGFMRNTQATFAASILNTSTNVKAILKFLNWVYKNEDNYNLCRYGIEGEHWIKNADGKTYSYPAGKENYLTSPAYSGILALVENQRISNLVYDGYTEEEKRWISIAENPENYIENDLIDYILPANESFAIQAQNNMYEAVVVRAWTGQTDPTSTFASAVATYRTNAKSHVEYQAQQYKIMKARFYPEDN